MFYFERFNNHKRAATQAEELSKKVESFLPKIAKNLQKTEVELEFLKETVLSVQKFQNILAWTFTYMYFIENEKEKQLFEEL